MTSIYTVPCHLCHGMLLSGEFIDSGRHIFLDCIFFNVLFNGLGRGGGTRELGWAGGVREDGLLRDPQRVFSFPLRSDTVIFPPS